MADNLAYTPGVGATVGTDDVAGVHFQKIKLDLGGDGVSVPATGDAANGMDVDVTRVQGSVTVVDGGGSVTVDDGATTLSVDDGGGALTVDSAQLPAALTGSGNLKVHIAETPTATPVTDNAGSLTVDSGQLPAALTGAGSLKVHIAETATAVPVTDNAGSLTVDDGATTLSVDDGGGALTVDGTVTANQGTPAAAANAWPAKISDGADTVGISTVGAVKALKVDVVQSVGAGAQVDKTAFTEGSGLLDVAGGVFNDTIASDPTEDQAAACRITAKRGLHVNLRTAAGVEIGTAGSAVRVDPVGTTTQPVSDAGGSLTVDMSATTCAGATAKTADYDTGAGTDTVQMMGLALPKSGGAVPGGTSTDPLRTDPTGATTQPVSGTVTSNQGTANATPWNENLKQIGGNAVVEAAAGVQKVGISDATGVAFSDANPAPVQVANARTPKRNYASATAGQSNIALWTPAAGKKYVIQSIILSVTGSGDLFIFNNTAAAANYVLVAGVVSGGNPVQINFPNGHPCDAANDILRYTTGAGTTAVYITVFGFEV
jgi:hypothetical protein